MDGALIYEFGTTDPSRGRLWITGEGCSSTPAFGATLSVSGSDSETLIAMADGISVDPGLNVFPANTSTLAPLVPGVWAYALVNDVPVGTTTLTTTYSGSRVGTMQVSIRPGAITSVVLAPTP
jgi:hypothetical protein